MNLTKKKRRGEKSIFRWVIGHVRPYVRWKGKGSLDSQDDFDDMIGKTKDNAEIGIKLKFKW